VSIRKKRSVYGFIASLGGNTTLQLVTLLVTPLYLDLTSQELFGLWLTLGSVLGWIKLGDMGIGMALTRSSVEALEKNNYDLLRRLIYGAILSFLVLGVIFSGIGYLLTDTLVEMFEISGAIESDFRKTFYVLLSVALIGPCFGVFGSVIEAKQHMAFQQINHTVITLLSIGVNVLLLFLGFGIIAFAFGLLFSALIIPFIEVIYLRRIDKRIDFFPIKTTKKDIISLLKFGGLFQILKIANLVSTSTDSIIIASILGTSFVSIYIFTGKLAFLFSIVLISIIPSVLFPGITQLFELGDKEKIARIYIKLSNISIRLGLFIGVFYPVVNESFVNLWVGSENYGGLELTVIFVVWIVLESFLRGITAIIYSSGELHGLAVVSFIEAGLNILLTLYFINSLGLFGVALATILSRLITLFYVPLKINKLLKINNFKYLIGLVNNTILHSIPMLIIVTLLNNYIDKQDYSIVQIVIIISVALITNIISFEGVFLMKQKGVAWKDRVKTLKTYYY
jgi:O-antigen/teichoic acid export membrane protein